ncbi:MAG: ribosome small subunit-dependent GTPase A [Tissierellia bacterium]|nr:ribosome small subunit-dependent GTPase A [Tissierellia bacterium]
MIRVVSDLGYAFLVRKNSSIIRTRCSSSLLRLGIRPIVGDYVELNQKNEIIKVKRRNSVLYRLKTNKKAEIQNLASNIDYVFIVSSLNNEFNTQKLERYILLTQLENLKPILILTKLDLCRNLMVYLDKLQEAEIDIPIILTSSRTREGLDEIINLIKEDKTAVLLGSSGVGKSSIINALMNKEVQKVKEVRLKDDKGRHTTTNRGLFYLKQGGCIIDTPGIREIGLSIGDILDTHLFEDISLLSKKCKFRDCKHETEPDCAVKEAVKKGIISKKYFEKYKKYRREQYLLSLKFDKKEAIKNKNLVKRKSKYEHRGVRSDEI